MISLTDYTTYAEIRATLGVSSYELPDTVLSLPLYSRALQTKLYSTAGTFRSITGTLVDIFEALNAVGVPTAEEENMLNLIQQLSTYTVAEACLSGLSLLALKSESDGEAVQTRFSSEATFRDVGASVRQQLASVISQIDSALDAVTGLPFLSRVPPSADVVTNESA